MRKYYLLIIHVCTLALILGGNSKCRKKEPSAKKPEETTAEEATDVDVEKVNNVIHGNSNDGDNSDEESSSGASGFTTRQDNIATAGNGTGSRSIGIQVDKGPSERRDNTIDTTPKEDGDTTPKEDGDTTPKEDGDTTPKDKKPSERERAQKQKSELETLLIGVSVAKSDHKPLEHFLTKLIEKWSQNSQATQLTTDLKTIQNFARDIANITDKPLELDQVKEAVDRTYSTLISWDSSPREKKKFVHNGGLKKLRLKKGTSRHDRTSKHSFQSLKAYLAAIGGYLN